MNRGAGRGANSFINAGGNFAAMLDEIGDLHCVVRDAKSELSNGRFVAPIVTAAVVDVPTCSASRALAVLAGWAGRLKTVANGWDSTRRLSVGEMGWDVVLGDSVRMSHNSACSPSSGA
jgi:hypothetical protein